MIRRAIILFLLGLIVFAPFSARAAVDKITCEHVKNACFDPQMWDAIHANGDGDQGPLTLALLHLAYKENRGKVSCLRSYAPAACRTNVTPDQALALNCGFGPMQITTRAYVRSCDRYAGGGEGSFRRLMHTSNIDGRCDADAAAVADASIKCAKELYLANNSICKTFAARLCGYGPPGLKHCKTYPDGRGCGYSKDACDNLGTEGCESNNPKLGKNPWTGEEYVKRFSDDQLAAVGGDPSRLPTSCVNVPFSAALAQATEASQTMSIMKTEALYRQQPIRDKLKCIRMLLTVYNAIKAILSGSGLSVIGAIILAFVGYIAQMIMDAVCNYIKSAINAVLSLVCLPIPKLPLLTLPSIRSQSCAIGAGGISLLQLLETPPGRLIGLPGSPQNQRTGRAIWNAITKQWEQE